MGQQIVSFKVWDKTGRVLYSTDDPASIGQVFPVEERLTMAWEGKVTSQISSLEDEENAPSEPSEGSCWRFTARCVLVVPTKSLLWPSFIKK